MSGLVDRHLPIQGVLKNVPPVIEFTSNRIIYAMKFKTVRKVNKIVYVYSINRSENRCFKN